MKKTNKVFELNLLPVISLLSVCISFLLLTAVWDEVKSVSMSQAIGQESENKKSDTLTVFISKTNQIKLRVDTADDKKYQLKVNSVRKNVSWNKLEKNVDRIKKQLPNLNVALIHPSKNTSYEDVVKVIDLFRTKKISDVGVSPL